jgi:hypothetical protein
VVHPIELNLRDINQLFNTIDPSPFPDRDLDRSAEDFILSWAQEFPIDEPIGLIIYLKKPPKGHCSIFDQNANIADFYAWIEFKFGKHVNLHLFIAFLYAGFHISDSFSACLG